MQKELNLRFVVIIPCFNEEEYISNCLDSIINQTVIPNQLIISNDGSTDSTTQIVNSYKENYSFIQQVFTKKKPDFQPGAKIVQAFKYGLNYALNWEIVFKLDADVILPNNYFELVLNQYNKDAKIGMVGGLVFVEKNGELQYENISDKKHLRGPIKSYKKDCYNAIGGLKESIGWDTIDEILAQYHGFQLKIIPSLKVIVQKPTGTLYKKSHAKKMGLAMYKMRYGFLIMIMAALKSAMNKNSAKSFFAITFSYIKSFLQGKARTVTKEEGKFVRQYRWKKITQKLFK